MDDGDRMSDKGFFEQAVRRYSEAAHLYGKNQKYKEHIEALVGLAQAYQSLQHFEKARVHLEKALSLARDSDLLVQQTKILGMLGGVQATLGRTAGAESSINEGIVISKSVPDNEVSAMLYSNLGNVFAVRQMYSEAIEAFNQSISYAKASGNPSLEARVLANLGKVFLLDNRFDEAVNRLNLSHDKYARLPDTYDKAFSLINVGKKYHDISISQNDYRQSVLPSAVAAYKGAASTSDAIGNHRIASYAYGFLGQLYESDGNDEEALHLTRMAAFKAQLSRSPESLYLWQWQTGRLMRKQGMIDDAISAYRQAIQTLGSLQQGIKYECAVCGKSLFRQSVKPIFYELADLLLKHSADLDNNKKYLIEARKTIELLKTAELRDYFQDECVDAYQGKMTSLDSVSHNTSVVYIIPFSDRLELLLSFYSGMKRISVDIGADEFNREIKLLRTMLEKRTTREYLKHSQQLYDWIVRPMESELAAKKVDTLVFVPDGALRSIPMAALHDGKEFLVSNYAIATTLGLNLTDPKPMQREGLDVLLSGLTESVQGYPSLMHVSSELDGIQNLYGGTLVKDQNFVIPSIKKELQDTMFSTVHIASHGEFSGDVKETFILTWDGKLTVDDLDRFIRVSRFRKTPIDLLTLSACQTAAGDDRAALGLAGISIKAGARSSLATLWNVNDEASSKLVVDFYTHLKDRSVTKAMALRKAQLNLINDRRYRHPFYWSPFLMIGNWL
jgi:CHAT domain-containing protein/predicted negative regulator of RcsB-dependent stress response